MIDRYTKAVLTIIAACLLFICSRPYVSVHNVWAQDQPAQAQEVKIVGVSSSVDIPVKLTRVAEGALVPVRIDGSSANVIVPVGIATGRGTIPVSIQNANPNLTIPVGIRAVGYNQNSNTWGWYPLSVKQGP